MAAKGQREKTPDERRRDLVENLKHNYRQIEKSIVGQLYMKQDLHGTTIGTVREEIWQQLFDMVLPKKFVVEHSVFIIDSHANASKEVDLAILDETYTPYIFRHDKLKYIPIEAVVAAVECKSVTTDPIALQEWVESIQNLKTAKDSIARMATFIATGGALTQQSTRPILILCALKKDVPTGVESLFDFTLLAQNVEAGRIDIKTNDKFQNLLEWYEDLNFAHEAKKFDKMGEAAKQKLETTNLGKYVIYETKERNVPISLLTFNFQLNQLLMLLNNPLLFPHHAYVEMFNEIKQGGDD